jgi:hypothetical protein
MQMCPPRRSPPVLVRKICVAGLAPSVAARVERDVFLGSKDPSHDIAAGSFDDWRVRILRHQPVVILVSHLSLKGLVIAHVDGLNKARASGGYELDFNPDCLDGADDRPHHMDSKGVQVE